MPLFHLLLGLTFGVALLAPDLAPTGTLRAAFLATNPVQARTDAATGAATGPVPDLVRELARRLEVPYALVPMPDAAGVIESLRTGRADIGFLAYEAARATQVDFSEPYLLMGSAYMVRADSGIARSADVDRAGVKVAAVKGQSQEIFVSANLTRAQVDVLPAMPASEPLVQMLVDRRIDAFAANRQRMEEIARTSTAVRVLGDDFLVIGQAIVVPKGQATRLDELNRFVTDIRRSGFVKASIERAGLTGVEAAPPIAR